MTSILWQHEQSKEVKPGWHSSFSYCYEREEEEILCSVLIYSSTNPQELHWLQLVSLDLQKTERD